jgi:hypothetical protein
VSVATLSGGRMYSCWKRGNSWLSHSAKRPFVGMVVLYYPAPEEGIGRAIDLALAVIPSKPERLCGSGDGH